ncbi:MAG: SRPBCC family protein [Steroidobacteraceae bacterium]
MAIEGEYRIGAPREAVWAALNDVDILKGCIPGCQELTRLSDTEIEGRIQAQLGPVKAAFGTRLILSDMDPPSGYTLSGEGKAAVGFGKGSAKVQLVEEEGGTLLRYSATMQLGGKLAQLGSRLVEGATRQLADQFFEAFARQVDAGAVAVPAAPTQAGGEDAPGSGGRWLRWVGIGGAVLLVLWLMKGLA